MENCDSQKPKVSVLMPIYNTPHQYLKEAIESILGQTFRDFELVIINDASADKELEKIVKSYNDSRIKYYENEKNLGISGTRNKLIDLAAGEYLAVFDHDDVSLPKRLEKQVAFLDENPDVGVVGCWFKYDKVDNVQMLPTSNREIKKQLFINCCMSHPSTMIRKSVLEVNNIRYEALYSPAEDYALWCRLISKTKFANIPEVLFIYRNYNENTSHTQREKMNDCDIRIKDFVKRDNPELWAVARDDLTIINRWKLGGIVPFLTVKKLKRKTDWLLLGKIPILSISKKEVISCGKE